METENLSSSFFEKTEDFCKWLISLSDLAALRSDPRLHVRLEQVQRNGAIFQNGIVEFSLVEFWSKLFFRQRAQFADFQLADLVGKRLPGPSYVPVHFDRNVLICLSRVVFEKLNRLLTRPAHRMHARVHNKPHGAPHFVRKLSEFRVRIFVQTE